MTKTFAEGSNAVGILGFVGFTSHVCTSRYLNRPWSTSWVNDMQKDKFCRVSNNANPFKSTNPY